MKADREKRASILLAEGEKQAAITRAEGEKESPPSCAPRPSSSSSIREAEGQAQALLLVQKAQGRLPSGMLNEAAPTQNMLALRSMEAMEKGGRRQGHQDHRAQSEMQNLAATVSAIKALAGDMPAAK